MNREESTSTTNDSEERDLEDKSLPSVEKPIPRKTYVSQLKIWNGIYSQANILKIFLRPFPFILSPLVSHLFLLKFFKKSEPHTPSNRLGLVFLHLECRPCFIVSVSGDLLIHKFDILPLGVSSICSSTIFTIEYNFTATQIVSIILINYKIL